MDRRAFIAIVGGSILATPRAGEAQAQLPAKVFTIGYLSHFSGIGETEEALRQGLREVGYVEGQNLLIEWRFAKGDLGLHPKLAAGLIALKVDCLITAGVSPTRAAMQATRTIPIVMGNASDDPVQQGLVASLARPGGNVTGFTDIAAELAGKRVELLLETVPTAKRVAILGHGSPAGTSRFTQFKATEAAARRLGVTLQSLRLQGPDELKSAFHAARAAGADVLIVVSFGFIVNHKEQIAELAISHRLPVMTTVARMVTAGSLMSYSPDFVDHYRRRVPRYVDKILKGAKPADLPVEQPTKFELVINLKTAKALGLTIPPSILGRADQIIQ
jgi:putative ABC transport system substrate-binding protein